MPSCLLVLSLGQVVCCVFCVSDVCNVFPLFLVVTTSAIDCLERLVSEVTYYVSSGMLNLTHSVVYTDGAVQNYPSNEYGQQQTMNHIVEYCN